MPQPDIDAFVNHLLSSMPENEREEIKRSLGQHQAAAEVFADEIRQLLNAEYPKPEGQRPAFDAAHSVCDHLWAATGKRDYLQMAAVGVVLLTGILIANSAEHENDPEMPSLSALNDLAVAAFDVVSQQWQTVLVKDAQKRAAAAGVAAHQGEPLNATGAETFRSTHKGMTFEDVQETVRKSRLAGDPATPAQRVARQGGQPDYIRPFPNMSRAVNTDDRQ